ncbi:PTS system beta-glucoside-specific EIIBCA component [Cellulomonas sp. T2.31MG-18]
MDYAKTAGGILDAVGGPGNVTHLEHCSTRLRFTVADTKKVDHARLKAVPGVMGVVGIQPQVVIGNDVVEVHAALSRLSGMGGAGAGAGHAAGTAVAGGTPAEASQGGWGARILDFIVGVFQPLIPAIAGAGVLKSLMLLATMFGLSKNGATYTTLVAISDATFFFLPLLVAVTTATKLNTNRLVAVAAVSVLVLPSMTKRMADGTSVFGLAIPNVTYSSQVFPAVLAVLLLAVVERFLTRVTPKPIRIFFVPMVGLLVTVPVTLLFLGPLGFRLGTGFTTGVLWVFHTLGWVAFPLLAVALPFIISVGMHKAFIPYVVNQLSTAGYEPLYNPVSLAHNIAESGASFGVALRTKDTEMRSTGVSAGLSALFGITEPALYGITIQNKRALISVLSGAAAGATWLGVTHVTSYVAVGPGLASMSMFINANDPRNIVNAIVGAAIAFVTAFVVAMLTWSDAASATLKVRGVVAAKAPVDPDQALSPHDVLSPTDGTVVPLAEVSDRVFAGGVLGDGCAVRPTSGEFRSPAAGVVSMLFDTHHAVAVSSDDGVDLLIHVGLDTVRLNGTHFTAHVTKGDRVEVGQLLITADLDAIRADGYDTTTPVVVTNGAAVHVGLVRAGAQVTAGAPLFPVSTRATADVS